MTHYYLYIAAGATLNADTRFYKVGIGSSEIQCKRRAWLAAYAFEHGHYFVRWSQDAVEFLIKCQQSIGEVHHEVVALMANDLYGILANQDEEPSCYQAELNRHHLMMQIDSSYYTANVIEKKISRESFSK